MKHLIIGYSIICALLITIGYLVDGIITSVIFYILAFLMLIVSIHELRQFMWRKEATERNKEFVIQANRAERRKATREAVKKVVEQYKNKEK